MEMTNGRIKMSGSSRSSCYLKWEMKWILIQGEYRDLVVRLKPIYEGRIIG